jgi:NADPH-dependent 2,4-dienoyl-CoA reductase/sulfur reductase-like enzyme
MTDDLAVIGAGPGGAHAALAAAAHGLSVVMVDENAAVGGQVWRAPAGRSGHADAEARAGAAMRARLAAAPITLLARACVWLIGRENDLWRIDLVRDGRAETLRAAALVLATGAHERVVPFPGWTTPGVIGLAAATILLKSAGVLPGRRCVVAGSGPLLAAVAAGMLKAGGEVAAVVDLAARREWLAALPRLAARPDLVWHGAAWLGRILRAGVPVLSRHAVVAADGEEALREVLVAPVDAVGRPVPGAMPRRFAADCLAVGHGLVPDTAATRLLRLPHRYVADRGGWIAERDETLAAPAPRLWLVGEVGGIGGAAVAALQGELAGLAVAHALGRLDATSHRQRSARLRGSLRRAERAGGAMARMMRLREGLVGAIPADTIICRCEDVTRAELEEAIAAGARDLNQLKQWTRCGMGPCQGRMCGETAATLLAARAGSREAAGLWTGRPPLHPVVAEDILGAFDYADIPIPPPAPI